MRDALEALFYDCRRRSRWNVYGQRRLWRVFIVLFVSLSMLGGIGGMFRGIALPEPGWLHAASDWIWAISILVSFVSATIVAVRPRDVVVPKIDDKRDNMLRETFIFFGIILLFAWMTRLAVLVSVPHIHSWVFGSDVTYEYVVEEVADRNQKGCSRPVTVADRGTLLINRICGLSWDLRQHLQPGTVIAVTGRGNSLIVRPRDVSIVSQPQP